MFIACMETQNFTFHALGATEDEARATLIATWDAHAKQYSHHELMAGAEAVEQYGAAIFPVQLGHGYRDFSPLYAPPMTLESLTERYGSEKIARTRQVYADLSTESLQHARDRWAKRLKSEPDNELTRSIVFLMDHDLSARD